MNARLRQTAALVAVGAALAQIGHGHAQQTTEVVPKLEAIAETKLLMEGLAHANFKGLERLLAKQPADAQAWTYARGQALLVAETGNLLMLRPPRNSGESVWMERAMALRAQAAQLAQTLARKDFEAARGELIQVGQHCNRCHQTFKVAIQIEAFAGARFPPPDAKPTPEK